MGRKAPKRAGKVAAPLEERLHGTACQTITGARLLMSTLAAKQAAHPELVKELAAIERLLARAATELREIIRDARET